MKIDQRVFKPIPPGTIVCAKVTNFDTSTKKGVFMVLYDEELDDSVYGTNCIALKVTSQKDYENYKVPINRKKNKFLNRPSVICCNKPWTLVKIKHIYEVLGHVDKATLKDAYSTYIKYNIELKRQVKEVLKGE